MRISFNELELIREKHKNHKIAFCSGCFDMTHAGHILFFEDCKTVADILVVALGNDFLIKKIKGEKRPILTQEIRAKTVSSLKPVDYCAIEPIFNTEDTLSGLKQALQKLKPDVYCINEDASNINYRKNFCQNLGINLKVFKRTCPEEFDEISTSKIIGKIKDL